MTPKAAAKPVGDLQALDHQAALDRFDGLSKGRLERALLQVVGDRNARPADLREQHWFLRGLSENEAVPPAFRVSFRVAASHKAMELLDPGLCEAMLDSLEAAFPLIERLSPNRATRRDRTHQLVSLYAVLLQLQLFLGRLDAFEQTARTAEAACLALDQQTLTRAFFVTSTNVLRCLAFASLPAVRSADPEGVQRSIYAMEQVCCVATTKDAYRHVLKHAWGPRIQGWLGGLRRGQRVGRSRPIADIEPSIAFFEYLQIIGIHHRLCEVRSLLHGGREVPPPSDLVEHADAILRVAIRSENRDKVERMIANYHLGRPPAS